MGYLELLRTQPGFRRLWLGQIVSELGDWLQIIALLGLFPTKGQAVELLAGIFIVRVMPALLWAPLAGVIADRYPRGQVMVACDLGRALIVLGYLGVRGPEDVAWIYLLMFAQESLTTLFEPARSAALPQVVEPRALLAANSLSGATWSAMLALGIPALVRDAESAKAHAADRFGVFALREGVAYLRAHRPQAAAALVKGLWGMCGGIVFLFSIYAGEIYVAHGSDPARSTGLLYAGRGVGALIGPLIVRRIWGESTRALRRGIQLGFPLAACSFFAFSYAPSALLGALCLVFAHAGGSTCWVSSTQLVQLTVPNTLQGRVFSVEQAGFTLSMALSNGLVGAALGHGLLGLRGATLVIAGAAVAGALLWAGAMRRLGARLDQAAVDADATAESTPSISG
jgi:hypothetical protein